MTAILATDTSAYHRVLDRLRDNSRKVRESRPGQAMAQCPAHDDHGPSLSITKIEASVLLHCHTGCHYEDVLAALALDKRDLYDDPGGAEYRYTDRAGKVLRTVHRRPDKTFWQSGNTNGAATTLFRLPEVVAAVEAGLTIYLVEGEKDVLAIESLGGVATTTPMGAGNVDKCDLTPLYGGRIIVIVDKDEQGEQRARYLRQALADKAEVEFAQAKVGKDAADHIAAECSLDELEPTAVETFSEDAPASEHEYRVQYELGRIRVKEEARRLYDAEQRPPMPPFDAGTLAEMLARPGRAAEQGRRADPMGGVHPDRCPAQSRQNNPGPQPSPVLADG